MTKTRVRKHTRKVASGKTQVKSHLREIGIGLGRLGRLAGAELGKGARKAEEAISEEAKRRLDESRAERIRQKAVRDVARAEVRRIRREKQLREILKEEGLGGAVLEREVKKILQKTVQAEEKLK